MTRIRAENIPLAVLLIRRESSPMLAIFLSAAAMTLIVGGAIC